MIKKVKHWVRVRTASDIWADRKLTESMVEWGPSKRVGDYLFKSNWDDEGTVAWLNGHKIAYDRWSEITPPPNSDLAFVRCPQVTGILLAAGVGVVAASLIGAAVNIALAIGASYLARKLAGSPKETVAIDSPTYSWNGIQTTTRQGQPIPLVYGELRISGQILGATTDVKGSGFLSPDESVLRMLIGCGEGPFQEVAEFAVDQNSVAGDNLPSSVHFNGNPLNVFPGVTAHVRLGNRTQSVIPGYGDLEVSSAVNIALTQGNEITTVTPDSIDGFRLIFQLPNGLFTQNDGKLSAARIDLQIRWRVDGATDWQETETVTINGANISEFRTSFRKELPEDFQNETIEIGVTKLTEGPEPAITDNINWETVEQLTFGDGQSYPHIPLFALEMDASANLQGGTPRITFPVKGKKVYVWDGVDSDPLTANFNFEYSTNPAWCALDLILNRRYGGGWIYNLCFIDIQSFGDWADYCDEMIDDGFGGQIKRWELGLVLDQQQPFWDAVQQIAATARASIIKVGNTIKVKIDRAASPVALFSMGNIIAETFSIEYGSVADRPNIIAIQFLNAAHDHTHDVAEIEDESVIDDSRPISRKEYMSLFGITHKARAMRACQYFLNQNRLISDVVQFEAGPDAIAVEPGDVIDVQTEMVDWDSSVGGRIQTATTTTVTLDRDLVVTSGQTWKIRVRSDGTGADVIQERTLIVSPGTVTAGTAIQLNAAWDGGDTPGQHDPYSAAPATLPVRQWRVVATELVQDLRRSIKAVNYDANVYDDTPPEFDQEVPDEPIDENTIPPRPTNLTLREEVATDDESNSRVSILASWTKEPHLFDYDFKYYLRESDNPVFSFIGRTRNTTARIENVFPGTIYCVAVVSVSPSGAHRNPEDGAIDCIEITGKAEPPSDMTDSSGSQDEANVILDWTEIADAVKYYEVRRNASGWILGKIIGTPVMPQFSTTNWAPGTETFWIRALSTAGRYSGGPAKVDLTLAVPSGLSQASGFPREESTVGGGWPGTLTSTQVAGDGSLELTAAATSGTYESPALDLTSIASRRIAIRYSALYDEPTTTWDSTVTTWAEATFTWADDDALQGWDDFDKTWDNVFADDHDWQGDMYSPGATFLLESHVSDDDVTYTSYQEHNPSDKSFRYVQFRVTLTRTNTTDYTVNVPSVETSVYS